MRTILRSGRVVGRALSLLLLTGAISTAAAAQNPDLIAAAKRGDVQALEALIESGSDVNAAQGDGMTALHWAADRGHVAVAERLLAAGAKATSETRVGQHRPLHLASRGGHTPLVRLLLTAGSEVDAKTSSSGVSALHLAAAAPNGSEAVLALLEHGADPNALESSAGQTPLMFAAANNRAAAVTTLLAHGADPAVETTVIDVLRNMAIDDMARDVVRDLVAELREGTAAERGWQPSPAQAQAIVLAQREYLLNEGPLEEVDPEGLTSLRPDYPGGPPVSRPPYRAKLVGKTGGMTALLHSAREGHVEAALALLDGGADINQVSGGDKTSPLLIATLNGQFDLAMNLVERGANADLAASTDGANPLFAVLQTYWAPKSNYPQPRAHDNQATEYLDLLESILEAGANPNLQLKSHLWFWEYGLTKIGLDLRGATPFWRAALAQDIAAMELLSAHGADPNIPTEWPAVGMRERRQQDGRQQEDSGLPWIPEGAFNAYPLHAAAGGGYLGLGAFSMRNVPDNFIPAVRYLLDEHGADINLRDSWGYTPLHYAASRGDNEMIDFLVERGADVQVITRLGQSTADMARGGRAGFFQRYAFPETVELLQSLGSTLECLHTHFLDTGDFCPLAGANDPWKKVSEEDGTGNRGGTSPSPARPSGFHD